MEPIDRKYKTQTFVCTNERPEGKACCHKVKGFEFFSRLKEKMKNEGLYTNNIVTRSGCLGYCNDVGTTLVIFRDGKPAQWHTKVTEADFYTIWNEITTA